MSKISYVFSNAVIPFAYDLINLFFDEAVDDISTAESLQFDFNTIRIATDDFSDANKLGQGGFGAVYKVQKILIIFQNMLTQKFKLLKSHILYSDVILRVNFQMDKK